MQAIADQVSELEKIFRGHPLRGDAVPSPAAAWLQHDMDALEVKRWLDCDVTSADHAQALRQRGVVPDFRAVRWFQADKQLKTLGEAYCSGDVDIEGVLEVLCTTLRGGVAIHVARLRRAAIDYDNASCAAYAATSYFSEALHAQRSMHLQSSVAKELKKNEIKRSITEFQAAHKLFVIAAQWFLDAKNRYVLDEAVDTIYAAELAACVVLVHEAKHRFPGALRPFALALAAELNEVAA